MHLQHGVSLGLDRFLELGNMHGVALLADPLGVSLFDALVALARHIGHVESEVEL